MTTLIFDWGDTVMRDFPEQKGPMAFWEKVELIPGIEEALAVISKQNHIMCIATSAADSDTELMKLALERAGVKKYFSNFFSSDELGFKKPDVRFFKAVLGRLKVSADDSVMIGNSYEKDIKGAKAAGMKTILFNEKNIKSDFEDADIVINNMSELYTAINKAGIRKNEPQ